MAKIKLKCIFLAPYFLLIITKKDTAKHYLIAHIKS